MILIIRLNHGKLPIWGRKMELLLKLSRFKLQLHALISDVNELKVKQMLIPIFFDPSQPEKSQIDCIELLQERERYASKELQLMAQVHLYHSILYALFRLFVTRNCIYLFERVLKLAFDRSKSKLRKNSTESWLDWIRSWVCRMR